MRQVQRQAMPKAEKPARAPARMVTMEHNTKSRGQHFLCNPLIIQVPAAPAAARAMCTAEVRCWASRLLLAPRTDAPPASLPVPGHHRQGRHQAHGHRARNRSRQRRAHGEAHRKGQEGDRHRARHALGCGAPQALRAGRRQQAHRHQPGRAQGRLSVL